MRAIRVRRAPWVAALASSFLAFSSGCLPSSSGASRLRYDVQGCLEEALRRDPDARTEPTEQTKETRETARATFDAQCAGGAAQACSVLGVMNEVGAGGPVDAALAVDLYLRACGAGNARGCTNLAVARLEGIGGPHEVDVALRILEPACEKGDARACLHLARWYDAAASPARDPAWASRLFESACDGGEAAACTVLATRRAQAGDRDDATEFYGKACSLGDTNACAQGEAPLVSSR